MNKPEAEAMIQRQRWRWGSDDSDEAIARRGERAFRAAGIAFTIGSAAEGLLLRGLANLCSS